MRMFTSIVVITFALRYTESDGQVLFIKLGFSGGSYVEFLFVIGTAWKFWQLVFIMASIAT